MHQRGGYRQRSHRTIDVRITLLDMMALWRAANPTHVNKMERVDIGRGSGKGLYRLYFFQSPILHCDSLLLYLGAKGLESVTE